jgi:hypothetical protein
MTLAAFALARARPLPIASAPELGDDHRPVELRDRAKDLTDQPRRRRVVEEGVRAVGRDQRDAEGLQLRVADLLDHQVAGEAAGGLDDDVASAVAGNVGQQGREARARLDRVGAGDGGVVELADNPVAMATGERLACLWRLSLSFSAPTLLAPEVLR